MHLHQPDYLFLCAVGRSGTTIFRRSLGLHPAIDYNGHENNIVQDLLEVAKKNAEMKSRRFAMVVELEEYRQAFRQLMDRLLWPNPSDRPVRMAAINPTGDLMPTLTQVFPRCKSIVLVRNGIEVVSSRMNYASFSSQAFEKHCHTWIRTSSVLDWGRTNPDSFRLFRHEWFYQTESLSEKLDAIYEWLAIPSDPAPEQNFHQTLVHPTGTPAPTDWSDSQRTTYFEQKRERWTNWNSEQKQLFEQICGDLMAQLGYEIPW